MYQFFVDDCQIGKEYVTITGSDVNHIKNVLRMRPGEKIRVSSSSRDMFCEIVELTDDFVQADILDEEAPDEELRREKMRKMAEKIQRVISVEKIQTYVDRQLEGKEELEASKLPLNNEDDFIKLIYVRLFGQRKNMGYTIETLEEREVNGYRFKDFRIRRKENGISGRNAAKRKG